MVHFSPPHLSVSCTKTGTHKCDSSSRQIENKFRSISTQWNGSCGNLAKWHRTKPGSVYSPILLCFLYLLTVAQVCIPTSTAFPSIIKHLLEQAHSLERKARKAIKPLPTGEVKFMTVFILSMAWVSKPSQFCMAHTLVFAGWCIYLLQLFKNLDLFQSLIVVFYGHSILRQICSI